MQTVITNHVIQEDPLHPVQGNVNILILWEDKSIYAFKHHIEHLQAHLNVFPISLVQTSQMVWENEDAILVKVSQFLTGDIDLAQFAFSLLGMQWISSQALDGQSSSVVVHT
jgi:hypothetical protein